MDALQKRLYDMEKTNPSPSLEGAKPTFKEKARLFWRDFIGKVEEADTDFTRQIKAYIAMQNRQNNQPAPYREGNEGEFDTNAAVVGGLVAGPYGFTIGGTMGKTLLGLDNEEDEEEVEQCVLRIE